MLSHKRSQRHDVCHQYHKPYYTATTRLNTTSLESLTLISFFCVIRFLHSAHLLFIKTKERNRVRGKWIWPSASFPVLFVHMSSEQHFSRIRALNTEWEILCSRPGLALAVVFKEDIAKKKNTLENIISRSFFIRFKRFHIVLIVQAVPPY